MAPRTSPRTGSERLRLGSTKAKSGGTRRLLLDFPGLDSPAVEDPRKSPDKSRGGPASTGTSPTRRIASRHTKGDTMPRKPKGLPSTTEQPPPPGGFQDLCG